MNLKSFYSFFLFLSLCLSASGTIPEGYYSTLEGKTTADLKTAAFRAIKIHSNVGYDNLWNYFPQTDCLPSNNAQIWDMYSNVVTLFSAHSSIDKEHCVPNSWWGGPSVDNEYAYSDLMNLFPSNNSINRSKSNNPLSEVGVTTMDNGVSKSGTSITVGYSGKGFEPADQYKGDFARTYFYMATCYQDYNWLSDSTGKYMITGGIYPSFQSWAIPLLLKWCRMDPVSEKELERNEKVYTYQHNRNPFVDYPPLVEYIWGDMKDKAWSTVATGMEKTAFSKLSVFPNPANDKISLVIDGYLQTFHYSIYSMTGSVVSSGETNNQDIDVSNLQRGVYSCVVQTASERLESRLIIL